MNKINFVDFYKQFIVFADRVLPSVKPVEQPILLHIFSRTVGMGRTICQLSYDDFQNLTELSLPTIKKSLRSLIERGAIRLVNISKARIAKTYEFVWPDEFHQLAKLQRNPDLLLRDMFLGEGQHKSFIDNLSPEDKDMLNVIISNLSQEDAAHYREISRSLPKIDGDPDALFREIVARERFGKLRLMQYFSQEETTESSGLAESENRQ